MVSLKNLHSLKKIFFKFDNVKEFHFELMNIVMLIREKYVEGDHYCYCDRYRKCCLFPLVKRCLTAEDRGFVLCANYRDFVTKKSLWRTCLLESF